MKRYRNWFYIDFLANGCVSSRFSARVPCKGYCSERQQTMLKCISVIFRAIEHLPVARNEREKKTGTRTSAATVGKRRRWLRYQLLGMRNDEAIEFPETKGAAGRTRDAGICFTIELELSRILRERRRKYLVIEINSRLEKFIYNSIAIYKCNLKYNLKF